MADIRLIEELTNAFGPSGFEEEVCQVIRTYTEGFDVTNDAMCNVYMKQKDFSGKKPVIMLDAHTDECGMMVQSIRENGLLNFVTLGSVHVTNLPAQRVIVRNGEGKKVKGIITSKPVHFIRGTKADSTDLSIEELAIDVGACSRQEAMEVFGIRVGDPAAFDVSFAYNEEQKLCSGKAFDNRLGCACIIETMKALEGHDLAVDVIGAFASQEELGMRGATVTSQVVRPDLAILFEGSPADDFYFSAGLAQCALHRGVQIRHMDVSYVANPVFMKKAREIGDKYGIPYQSTVRRGGGTDAGKISLEGKAVPVLVLGIPSRYVHTSNNFCALEDVDAAVRMATELIKSMDESMMNEILRKDLWN